jgi:hypothetical protein
VRVIEVRRKTLVRSASLQVAAALVASKWTPARQLNEGLGRVLSGWAIIGYVTEIAINIAPVVSLRGSSEGKDCDLTGFS